MLKAIHTQEDKDSAKHKTDQVTIKRKIRRLEKTARIVKVGAGETFSFYESTQSLAAHKQEQYS